LSHAATHAASGSTSFHYKVVDCNAFDYCTQAIFNLTDAQRVVWLP
jgi:hypothetical protein